VARAKKRPFSLRDFLKSVNGSGTEENYRKNQNVYGQGDPADSVFYVREGKLKVSIVSEHEKEAVVAMHGEDDFFGEGCLTGQVLRLATVAAMTGCVVTRIPKATMVATLRDEPKFSA
jgi:CRP/FNR family transcriptional regulator, cyclic AMP receptor protein